MSINFSHKKMKFKQSNALAYTLIPALILFSSSAGKNLPTSSQNLNAAKCCPRVLTSESAWSVNNMYFRTDQILFAFFFLFFLFFFFFFSGMCVWERVISVWYVAYPRNCKSKAENVSPVDEINWDEYEAVLGKDVVGPMKVSATFAIVALENWGNKVEITVALTKYLIYHHRLNTTPLPSLTWMQRSNLLLKRARQRWTPWYVAWTLAATHL